MHIRVTQLRNAPADNGVIACYFLVYMGPPTPLPFPSLCPFCFPTPLSVSLSLLVFFPQFLNDPLLLPSLPPLLFSFFASSLSASVLSSFPLLPFPSHLRILLPPSLFSLFPSFSPYFPHPLPASVSRSFSRSPLSHLTPLLHQLLHLLVLTFCCLLLQLLFYWD